MPTYITLWNYTQKGVENIKESPERLEIAKELGEEMGAELKGFYLTFGQYDLVTIAEYPDDETVARHILSITSKGTATTETLKAFPEAEAMELIQGIPE